MTTILWLTTCETAGSNAPRLCPPVVVDSAADQARPGAVSMNRGLMPEGPLERSCDRSKSGRKITA